MSYHKNSFSNDSVEKFLEFFKISDSSRFNRSILFPDQSKCEEENYVFSLKSWVPSIPSRFLSISRAFSTCIFRFLLDYSWAIEFQFFKTYRNQIRLFQKFFVFLSDSSLDPFSQKNFVCHFLGQSFKSFLQILKVRPFWPSFLIILHVFMHFSCIF